MTSAFVATTYKHRHEMSDVLDIISENLSVHGYTPLVFVQHYNFAPQQTKLMMETSVKHIRECDLFIAELTHKVVGVGIEAGFAYACNKPIVYIHRQDANVSTTLSGIADYHLAYADNHDLNIKLDALLTPLV
jgi:2'-deoxynucleoside 5'-phosphate N-hydrolase